MVEALIRQYEAQQLLQVDPRPDGVGGLSGRERLHNVQEGDEGEPALRLGRQSRDGQRSAKFRSLNIRCSSSAIRITRFPAEKIARATSAVLSGIDYVSCDCSEIDASYFAQSLVLDVLPGDRKQTAPPPVLLSKTR